MKPRNIISCIAFCLCISSCSSSREVAHTTDTLYIAQRQYDSVVVDRQTSVAITRDTVFIHKFNTEYRYRSKTDTFHHHHTDTVVKTIVKRVPPTSRGSPWIIAVAVALAAVTVAGKRRKT